MVTTAEILNAIEKRFQIIELSGDIQYLLLRSSISDSEEAHEFINLISNCTKSDWIVYKTLRSPKNLLFRKKWKCQHSEKNKRPKEISKRNTGCPAYIDIIIKKTNKDTRYRDRFIKMSLPAIIKMNLQHNHALNTVESMQMLRVSEKVKEMFYEYFSEGYNPTQAAAYHECKVQKKMSPESLADAKINPTSNQIEYMFKKWKSENSRTAADS